MIRMFYSVFGFILLVALLGLPVLSLKVPQIPTRPGTLSTRPDPRPGPNDTIEDCHPRTMHISKALLGQIGLNYTRNGGVKNSLFFMDTNLRTSLLRVRCSNSLFPTLFYNSQMYN